MTTNVGGIDRALRIIAGIALIAFALLSGNQYAWIGWIGVVPLATAMLGWCPAYSMIGVSTCSR
ncbi:YgaP family membrane protein [Blastochloris sulfoviridis]|uniref:DUF2892 domain-containing protein n=1 Tax=Blastochloris sulfoviridis TaxID=50712 RepID=A0A5M6I3T6_9HYPH|nr:DUF2892 domain-containing protein [Blastochloris sulfoviridis]KAA5602876.1 DUF2892 domain-containing protein [Blastochloris sulfoviridis]